MKVTGLVIGVLTAAMCCGCPTSSQTSSQSKPQAQRPTSLPATNAVLGSTGLLLGDRKGDASAGVVLTARCVSDAQYGKERQGKWDRIRHVVTFEVIKVEKGNWNKPTVSFICVDSWPTPESGIIVEKAPWPYVPGTTMRLWLDAGKTPAILVGQEKL
jgi:hypothetical protein